MGDRGRGWHESLMMSDKNDKDDMSDMGDMRESVDMDDRGNGLTELTGLILLKVENGITYLLTDRTNL